MAIPTPLVVVDGEWESIGPVIERACDVARAWHLDPLAAVVVGSAGGGRTGRPTKLWPYRGVEFMGPGDVDVLMIAAEPDEVWVEPDPSELALRQYDDGGFTANAQAAFDQSLGQVLERAYREGSYSGRVAEIDLVSIQYLKAFLSTVRQSRPALERWCSDVASNADSHQMTGSMTGLIEIERRRTLSRSGALSKWSPIVRADAYSVVFGDSLISELRALYQAEYLPGELAEMGGHVVGAKQYEDELLARSVDTTTHATPATVRFGRAPWVESAFMVAAGTVSAAEHADAYGEASKRLATEQRLLSTLWSDVWSTKCLKPIRAVKGPNPWALSYADARGVVSRLTQVSHADFERAREVGWEEPRGDMGHPPLFFTT